MLTTHVELALLRLWIWTSDVQTRLHQRMMGQSTVEYALVGALVVIAAAGALTILGGQITSVFGSISSTLHTAGAGAASGH